MMGNIMVKRTRRIPITLADEKLEQVERYAKDAGMQLSQYLTLCISIGLRTMARITEPELIYTPDQQAALMAAAGFDKEALKALLLEKYPEWAEPEK